MPRILFWNVERMGAGSNATTAVVKSVLDHLQDSTDLDAVFFCEITSDATLDDLVVNKQGEVKKRAKTSRQAQLGYGAIELPLGAQIDLSAVGVAMHSQVMGASITFRGGNSWTAQSKRHLVKASIQLGGADIYLYHANASYKAGKLLPWAINDVYSNSHLAHMPAKSFVMFGDFNCEPSEIDISALPHMVKHSDGNTHHVRRGVSKTYDWAISNIGGLTVDRLDLTDIQDTWCCGLLAYQKFATETLPDHFPIMIEW